MVSFTFLVQATQEFLDILLGLSVPPLPDRMACHGKSSAAMTGLVYTTPAMHHVPPTSGLAAFPLRPLPPRATVYRHRILQAIEHPY